MLGLCLCFKDSAAYLEEWLLFHHFQGFRKFYLYDNGSNDHWETVVGPWVDAGLVETIKYPGLGVQERIYNDCLRRAAGVVTWLGFLDDDEFLFPTKSSHTLEMLFREYELFAGVAVSWILFGSSGAETQTDTWVTERFCASSGVADHHVKCIVRPERVIRSKVIGHAFDPVPGYYFVDENKVPISEALNPKPSAQIFRINHYLVKSWEEWPFRRGRPQANTGLITPHPEPSWREWDRDWSRLPDDSAGCFKEEMIALRDCMKGRLKR